MHEYCTNCEADLTMQKGFDKNLPYWICKGCGEMLINPNIMDDSGIVWLCDGCESMLNIQEGFNDNCGEWQCSECGYINKIDQSEIFQSDDEYQAAKNSPYKGMNESAVLEIMTYEEIKCIDGKPDIFLVKNIEDGRLYIKKILNIYDKSIYEYLKAHPVENMPIVYDLYEGTNYLIVIEEYIEGVTLSELLVNGTIEKNMALYITKSICKILIDLHSINPPIIHRDIKPSNIIISKDNNVYLLDMNVAKWVKENESEDTRLLGTPYYAAPEQLGYGMSSSNEKADIYSVGILFNVMLTGKLPKEQKPEDDIWRIVEKCISLEPKNRYNAQELMEILDNILEN